MYRRKEERQCNKGLPMVLSGLLTLAFLIGGATVSQALADEGNAGKGVNYETGNGMNQLNCDSGNVKQIQADMAELAAIASAMGSSGGFDELPE